MKLLAVSLLLFAGQEFDKTRHLWAKWKVDSSAKYTLVVEAVGQKLEGDYVLSLAELKDKELTIRQRTNILGAEHEAAETESLPEKKGEETLKIGDKEYPCVVWTSSLKRGEKDGTAKVWIPAESEVELKIAWKAGEDDRGEFLATRLSDKIKAAGQEFDCVLLEGELTSREFGTVKGKLWVSPRVPGGMVRMELASDEAKILIDLKEFEAKK